MPCKRPSTELWATIFTHQEIEGWEHANKCRHRTAWSAYGRQTEVDSDTAGLVYTASHIHLLFFQSGQFAKQVHPPNTEEALINLKYFTQEWDLGFWIQICILLMFLFTLKLCYCFAWQTCPMVAAFFTELLMSLFKCTKLYIPLNINFFLLSSPSPKITVSCFLSDDVLITLSWSVFVWKHNNNVKTCLCLQIRSALAQHIHLI